MEHSNCLNHLSSPQHLRVKLRFWHRVRRYHSLRRRLRSQPLVLHQMLCRPRNKIGTLTLTGTNLKHWIDQNGRLMTPCKPRVTVLPWTPLRSSWKALMNSHQRFQPNLVLQAFLK
ncbi:hypothetical protein RSOL_207450 [Rhizoctonia solani AG-3 Rhs1AP]|uniref:Uncharacterized protein n=2 Tax=Rhizoctonia solani AG-3 TaxID=1086053 RepID=A0A074S5C4_9AGAM|nr:hypothetical protein RSOL_207450 [Rhizoctonia solani AG-3 Rhs1AP]KEP52740.1 hypothetical protein V565_040810 [Rhizoctonia solani 123E]